MKRGFTLLETVLGYVDIGKKEATHLHGGDEPGYLGWQLDRFDSAASSRRCRSSRS